MRWVSCTHGGPRRVNHAAAVVQDKVYSFGGFCTGDNYRDETPIDVFVLDTATNRWSQVPKPDTTLWLTSRDQGAWPKQRYGHSVVAYKDRIFLFGGRADYHISSDVHCFDTRTSTWSTVRCSGVVPPSTRDGHSACVVGTKMIVLGGYAELFYSSGIGNLMVLDLETFEWSVMLTRGEAPSWRDFHTATTVGRRMFVFGGRCVRNFWAEESDEFYLNTVTYLDLDTATWVEVEETVPAPEGRRSHSAVNLNGNILIFGGYNSTTDTHMNDMWMFDTVKWGWKEVKAGGEGPNPRRRQSMVVVGSKIYVFGGTCPYDGPSIYYSDEQLSYMPPMFRNGHKNLIDLDDLHVLDLRPSLQTLCVVRLLGIVANKDKPVEEALEETGLPRTLLNDMRAMYVSNTISKPLQLSKLTSG